LPFLKYEDKNFEIFDEVYQPSDDTYLILDYIKEFINDNDFILDLGTGCGILGIVAADKASRVVLTDISPIAIECANENIKNNNFTSKVEARLGNLFEPINNNEQFDLILFNPPYIPIDDSERKLDWIEKAWDGGKNGREIIDKFLNDFENYLKDNGRVLMIQTSLSNYENTVENLKNRGLFVEILEEIKFPFERIAILLIKK